MPEEFIQVNGLTEHIARSIAFYAKKLIEQTTKCEEILRSDVFKNLLCATSFQAVELFEKFQGDVTKKMLLQKGSVTLKHGVENSIKGLLSFKKTILETFKQDVPDVTVVVDEEYEHTK